LAVVDGMAVCCQTQSSASNKDMLN